jgi:hypothetical protein
VSIITANTIWQIVETGKGAKVFIVLQYVVFVALWLAVILLSFGTFSLTNPIIIVVGLAFFILSSYFLLVKRTLVNQIIYSALITIIGVNFLLDTHFYPTLLQFQAGSVAGKTIAAERIPTDSIYAFNTISHPLDFYAQTIVKLTDEDFISHNPGIWIYTTQSGKNQLEEKGIDFTKVRPFESYPVTLLTMEFLNPSTRAEAVSTDYLLRIE